MVKFIFVKSLTKRITLGELWDSGIVPRNGGPRPFDHISDADFDTILAKSQTKIHFERQWGMATILLSIKPEYANKIFDGQKHYEYRKRIPKKEVSKIVVYSSAPEQAVIGEVEVVKTLKMKPTPLWNSTKANAGISRSKYRKYFSGCTTAYAFVIGSFEKYPTSKSLADLNIQSAPQSFVYLDDWYYYDGAPTAWPVPYFYMRHL